MIKGDVEMKITWYGTATIGIDDGETKIIFDPFVRMNNRIETTPVEGFAGFDSVFVTHGHLDHIYSIPDLLKVDENVPVYCTETPKKTLVGRGAPEERINVIAPGDVINVGKFKVTVWKFRHIVFDPFYILTVVPKCVVMFPRLFWQAYMNRKMPEGGEIVAYEIENEGKKIFLTGSFREAPEIEYPKNVDLFVLANGGSIFVPEKTKDFIDKTAPQRILVDHFDNAFPPVTRNVGVKRLKKTVNSNHPEIKFIVPEVCKAVEL